MAKTKELIAALIQADPSGELEVVVRHEGSAYSVLDSAEQANVEDGEILDDEDEANGENNCVVIETNF